MEFFVPTSFALLLIAGTCLAEPIVPKAHVDYVCAGLPLIYIGPPELETARYIKENDLGLVISSHKVEDIRKALDSCPSPDSKLYRQWAQNGLAPRLVEISG